MKSLTGFDCSNSKSATYLWSHNIALLQPWFSLQSGCVVLIEDIVSYHKSPTSSLSQMVKVINAGGPGLDSASSPSPERFEPESSPSAQKVDSCLDSSPTTLKSV